MDAKEVELNRVYQDLAYGRDFALTARVMHPNSEEWFTMHKIATGQNFTVNLHQLLRDFEPKQPSVDEE